MKSFLWLKGRHIRANKFGLIQIPCSLSLGRIPWGTSGTGKRESRKALEKSKWHTKSACLPTLWCPAHSEGFGIVPTTHYRVDALVADPWGREEKNNDRKSMFSALEVIHSLKVTAAFVWLKDVCGNLTLHQDIGNTTHQLDLNQKY